MIVFDYTPHRLERRSDGYYLAGEQLFPGALLSVQTPGGRWLSAWYEGASSDGPRLGIVEAVEGWPAERGEGDVIVTTLPPYVLVRWCGAEEAEAHRRKGGNG